MAKVNSQYTLDFILDLRHAYPPLSGKAVVNFGSAKGDNGGGSFYWDETSVADDDAATVIKPYIISDAGRWLKEPAASSSITVESTDLNVTAGADPDAVVLALKDVATPGTGTKATIDSKGRVTAVTDAALSEIADVSLTTPAANDALVYDGSAWVNSPTLNQTFGTSNPTSGTYATGAVIWNSNPTAGSPLGWVCTAGGTPGTWNTFGIVGDPVTSPPPATFNLVVVSPTDGQLLSGNATFTVQAPGFEFVDLFDENDIRLIRVTLDANGFATGSFSSAVLSNGDHTLTAYAQDTPDGTTPTNTDTVDIAVTVNNGVVIPTNPRPGPIANQSFVLAFQEEFDAPIDLSPDGNGVHKWYWNLWYQNQVPNTAKYTVSNSVLRLTNNSLGNQEVAIATAGDVAADATADGFNVSQTYYVEYRARFDATNPACWGGVWQFDLAHAAGTDGGEWHEVDTHEQYQDGVFVGTNHDWRSSAPTHTQNGNNWHPLAGSPTLTEFHTYGCLVDYENQTIKWYFDDVFVAETDSPYAITFNTSHPHYFIIQIWEHDSGTASTWTECDWIRVWVKGTVTGGGTPTPTGTAVTWNPADKSTSIALTNNNLTATCSASDFLHHNIRTNTALSGKKYWEWHVDVKSDTANHEVALMSATASLEGALGLDTDSISYVGNGSVFYNDALAQTYATYVVGDTIQMAYDADTGKVWFGKNNTWNGDPSAGTGQAATLSTSKSWKGAVGITTPNDAGTLKAKASDQTYSPPSGFSAYDPN